MMGTDDVHANQNATSANFQFGDNPRMYMSNPGNVDPRLVNPYAKQYLDNNSNLYNEFSNSAAGGAFNPDFYKGLEQTQQSNLTNSMGNLMASRGLAGSSAEMGNMNNAIQTNQMNWLNRQQSDQMKALTGLSGLNQQGYNMTTGIQKSYGDWQNDVNQMDLSLMGLKQQQSAANSGFWGQILGGGLGALGSILGKKGGGGQTSSSSSPASSGDSSNDPVASGDGGNDFGDSNGGGGGGDGTAYA